MRGFERLSLRSIHCGCAIGLSCAPSVVGAQDITFFDKPGELALVAKQNAGVQEPSVILFHNGALVDGPGPGVDLWDLVDFFDRVPGTSSFPLTRADIVANGYIRPLVQNANGQTTPFGTSFVTHPSFRPAGGSLDTVPDMLRADVFTGAMAQECVDIVGIGTYTGAALVTSTREYVDPIVGRTETLVHIHWEATRDIAMDPGSRGNDAFRLAWFSSMLGLYSNAEYDANYLMVEDDLERRWTRRLADQPRPRYLFASPRPMTVGHSFALLKDSGSTWNFRSPSMQVDLLATSGPIGQVGVQGFLAGTIDENDDSLSVWMEWMDVPSIIIDGTVIEIWLRLTASPATDPGDLDHDEDFDRPDAVRLRTLLGRTPADPDFDAYADLDLNEVITEADYDLFVSLLPFDPADYNESGLVNTQDLLALLNHFSTGNAGADVNGDGVLNTSDIVAFLGLYVAAI